MLDKDEVKVIIALICEKQDKIIKDNDYNSEEYLKLEQIKIKLKSIGG